MRRMHLLALLVTVCLPARLLSQTSLGGDRPRVEGELTLARAIEIGIRESLKVQAAQFDADAARAATRIARGQTRPQMSATTHLTTGDSPNIFTTSPNVPPVNYLLVPSKPFADQNVTLMVPLYTGGRLSGMIQAAGSREVAAKADVNGAQLETSLRITVAYYQTLKMAAMGRAAQARVDAATELERTTRIRFEVGSGIEAAVRRTEAELADGQRMVTSARNDEAKSLLDLKAAMGVQLDSPITLADSSSMTPPAGDLPTYLADAARNRPEIRAAYARLEAARADLKSASGALQPQVYGAAMADGFAAHRMSSGAGYSVGLTLSLPILEGGQLRALVDQARSLARRAEAETKETELRVANEVTQAWLDVQTTAQNYRTAQTALLAAQSAHDVVALRVQNQRSILVEQLDAQAALTQARANLANSQYDHAVAVARLKRMSGVQYVKLRPSREMPDCRNARNGSAVLDSIAIMNEGAYR